MSQSEEFLAEVRVQRDKYFQIQIPHLTGQLMNLKNGTLLRVKISVEKEDVSS